jgi:hypothetical protein
MAATCPRCGGRFSVTKVQAAFSCPSCGVSLSAKVFMPFVGMFALWSIADLFLMLILGAMIQENTGFGTAVRIGLSGVIGCALFVLGGFFEHQARNGGRA